tara:strand:- start:2 stop:484 length:483 start_codon:yes stop_codon:yes gene_type:complete
VFANEWKYEKEIDEFDGTIKQTLSAKQIYPQKNSLPIKLLEKKEDVLGILIMIGINKYEDGSENYYLHIMTVSENWNILNAKTGKVLLDGTRWNNHKFVNIGGDVSSSSTKVQVYEHHEFQYSYEDFIKLTKAKNFKAKVGSLIYSIDFSKANFKKFNLK